MFAGIADLYASDERPDVKALGTWVHAIIAIVKKYPNENLEYLKDDAKFFKALGQSVALFDSHMRAEGGVTDTLIHEVVQAGVDYGKVVDSEKDTKKTTYFVEGWNEIAKQKGLSELE